MHVAAEQQLRAPRPPATGAHIAIAFRNAPRRGHEQRPGQVRGRLGQDAGRVADRDAAPRARRDVDVVEADRVVRNDLQPGPGRVQELVVDPVREERQHAVAAGDPAQQFGARRRQLVLPNVGGTGGR